MSIHDNYEAKCKKVAAAYRQLAAMSQCNDAVQEAMKVLLADPRKQLDIEDKDSACFHPNAPWPSQSEILYARENVLISLRDAQMTFDQIPSGEKIGLSQPVDFLRADSTAR